MAEVLATASRGQAPLSDEEQRLLDELGGWAEERRHRPDARAGALLAWLTDTCRSPGGGWNDERVIIFTEYRDTQKWLIDLLLSNGFGGDGGASIATLNGGMDTDDRERTKAEFQAHPSRSQEGQEGRDQALAQVGTEPGAAPVSRCSGPTARSFVGPVGSRETGCHRCSSHDLLPE